MDLEEPFDVVIIGTGLAESILSAACSRIGKAVLHLDNNSFYGESWSSFNFEHIVEWLKYGKVSDALYFNALDQQTDKSGEQVSSNEKIDWADFYKTITNIEIISYLIDDEPSTDQQEKWWSAEDFKKLSRKFSIDLCPKLLFATGSMVQLFVSSNISRYMSFKSVTRMLCNKDENLELIQVPYSRQTIFLSNSISLIEKRILMKFIQFCLEVEKNEKLIENFLEKPFTDLMSNHGLTPFLQKVVLQCVLFTNDNKILTKNAMLDIKKFVDSSGRYEVRHFYHLCTVPGRCLNHSAGLLSALFAGTFLLNNTIDKLVINRSNTEDERTTFELIYRQKHIKATHLITSINSTPKQLINSGERSMISRGIFITNRSIKQVNDENAANREISLVCLDCGDNYRNVYLLELSSTLCVCPDDMYLVYIWTESVQTTAKQDLLPIVKKLFNFSTRQNPAQENSLKPSIIWSCYYNAEYINGSKNSNLFKDHHVLSTAYNELDYERTIDEARSVFAAMFPENEFCERAPDLEELVFEQNPKIDEQENGVKGEEDDQMDVN